MTRQEQVKEFMLKAGQACPDKPKVPAADVRELRIRLIAEELTELCLAMGVGLHLDVEPMSKRQMIGVYPVITFDVDMVESYDALIDLEVVTTGAAVAMGLNTEPGWKEVHRSNMSKFIDGHRREDGKWVKGPSYSPAKLLPIITAQLE